MADGRTDGRLDAERRRRTRVAEEAQARLAGVAQQSFVHRPPPRAARMLIIERVEEATPQLPAHERQRRARIREMQRRRAGRRCIGRSEQLHPAIRTIADLGDALCGDPRGRNTTQRIVSVFGTSPRHRVVEAEQRRSALDELEHVRLMTSALLLHMPSGNLHPDVEASPRPTHRDSHTARRGRSH
jgi:hypothetical protein